MRALAILPLTMLLAAPISCARDVIAHEAGDAEDRVLDASCPPEIPTRCAGSCVDTSTDPAHCGVECLPCPDPTHGVAACVAGVCAPHCVAGFVARDGVCIDGPAPRPVRPLTSATVSVRHPTLHWALPDGVSAVHVTICRDRACTQVETEFNATGSSAAVPLDLARGIWFWNLRAITAAGVSEVRSATWVFHTPALNGPVEWSRLERPDLNGDGIGDLLISTCLDPGSGVVLLYLGNPDVTGVPLELGQQWFSPIGDVDGDGFTDLAHWTSTGIDVLGGGSDPSHLRPIQSIGGGSMGVDLVEFGNAIGDFNGDGYADTLIFTIPRSSVMRIGYGSRTGWSEPLPMLAGLLVTPLVAVDFDADGYDDLLGSGGVWWRGGPAGLTGPLMVSTPPSALQEGLVVAVGDIDEDGYLDGVQFDSDGRGIIVLARGGPSGLTLGDPHALAPGTDQRQFIGSFGDLNEDGRTDLLFTASGTVDGGRDFAFLATASGYSYLDSVEPMLPCLPIPSWGARTVGDWNGDGLGDVGVVCDGNRAGILLSQHGAAARWLPLSVPAGVNVSCSSIE